MAFEKRCIDNLMVSAPNVNTKSFCQHYCPRDLIDHFRNNYC